MEALFDQRRANEFGSVLLATGANENRAMEAEARIVHEAPSHTSSESSSDEM